RAPLPPRPPRLLRAAGATALVCRVLVGAGAGLVAARFDRLTVLTVWFDSLTMRAGARRLAERLLRARHRHLVQRVLAEEAAAGRHRMRAGGAHLVEARLAEEGFAPAVMGRGRSPSWFDRLTMRGSAATPTLILRSRRSLSRRAALSLSKGPAARRLAAAVLRVLHARVARKRVVHDGEDRKSVV